MAAATKPGESDWRRPHLPVVAAIANDAARTPAMDGSAPISVGEVHVASADHYQSGGARAVAADLVYEEFALQHQQLATDCGDCGGNGEGDNDDDDDDDAGGAASASWRRADAAVTAVSTASMPPLVVVYRLRLLRRPAAADPTKLTVVDGVPYPAFLTAAHLVTARARVRQMTSSELLL